MPAIPSPSDVLSRLGELRAGLLAAITVGLAARFLSDHYGAPAMLMALLLGISFQFLHQEGPCRPGIDYASRGILRLGVALLGLRVSWQLLADLGPWTIVVVAIGVGLTIAAGVFGARLLKADWRFGVLTGGSVAICGASAAMAISAVLPRGEHSERNLIFTVMSVTVLSTIAMIAYPMLVQLLGYETLEAGLFLGGTIHDVAQVVGAGYTISEETGDISTVVKLLRVTLLAPVIFIISLYVARISTGDAAGGKRPPLLPAFVVAFLVLALTNSLLELPAVLLSIMNELSRWMLLIAVAAVGMKTSLGQIREVGRDAVVLIVGETLAIAVFFLAVLAFWN